MEVEEYATDWEEPSSSAEWNSQEDDNWYDEVYCDDDSDSDEPPPAEDYCTPGFTAGPSGSGGWTTHGRLWSRLQSSTEHRQTADALSAWRRPDGQWEVALAGTRSLIVHRFPSAEQEEGPLPHCCIQVSTPYTIARSSDGTTVVTGNDHGFVRVFTLNEARPQAHVRLEALLYLGSHGVQLQNNMINCLRFFRFAEKEYLLTAGQDKYLYILQNPNTEQNTRTGERQEGRQYLPRAWPRSELLEHRAVRADVPIMASDSSASVNAHTPAIGPFPEPCNTAQPSPCARYIAVLIDAPVVYVLLRADDFSLGRAKRLPFLLDRPPSWADRSWVSANVVYGGQYCAWSPASDLLAMSSDAFHAVLIWSVPSFQQVMSIEGTMEPALSITFSPCEPALLVFCERSGRLYILDVFEELQHEESRHPKLEPARTLQCISRHAEVADIRPADGVLMPAGAAEPDFPIGRLNGLAVTSDGRILAATREGLLEIPLLKPWSFQTHRFFPVRLKRVVRTVLLCASRGTGHSEGLALADLPKDVVLKVIHHLAASYKSYFPFRAGQRLPFLSRKHHL